MMDKENRYGTRDRQIELLRMITDIDAILQKHEVKYSLYGGTLLGAVRDKGFIPGRKPGPALCGISFRRTSRRKW